MDKSLKFYTYLVLIIFAIVSIYPLFHVFITSFKQVDEYIENRVFPPRKMGLGQL